MNAFVRFYGARPTHLLTLMLSFALIAYVGVLIGPQALWNDDVWWKSIAVWFLGSVLLHDLVLYPLYALSDRTLSAAVAAVRSRAQPAAVSPLNYIRIPVLATGLTFLIFFPGIISQGAQTYEAATGLTQEPFLGRWLALTAAVFTLSALAYLLRYTAVHFTGRRFTSPRFTSVQRSRA